MAPRSNYDEVSRICLTSPVANARYRGYISNPQANADTFTPDGWLKTGDIGIVDTEGNITIIDRVKELIKYKAFQGTEHDSA